MTIREITASLRSLPGWRYFSEQKAIIFEFKTKDFVSAIRWIQKITSLAEKADHHPDIHLTRYRHLKILLKTHDAGGVTQKDIRLAKQILVD